MIPIPDDHKFAVLGLPVLSLQQEIRIPLSADASSWATSQPPVEIDEEWRRSLGIRAERFSMSNLFLFLLRPSETALVLDDESLKLTRRLRHLYVALGILGVQFENTGLLISGGKLPSPAGLVIRSVEDTSRQFFLKQNGPLTIKESDLIRAARIAQNIDLLHLATPSPRIWRGLRSLAAGLDSRYGDERLHYFVRSIDAVTKLPRGKAQKEFARRCQLFSGRKQGSVQLLEELYQLRSAAEHLNTPDSVLRSYTADSRNRVGMTRSIQAEVLARFVYAHILGSEQRTRDFMADANLDALWQMKDSDAELLWDETIDLLSL